MKQVPAVGSSRRFSRRRNDDFPDPLGPTIASTSACATASEMLSTIGRPSATRLKCSVLRMGVEGDILWQREPGQVGACPGLSSCFKRLGNCTCLPCGTEKCALAGRQIRAGQRLTSHVARDDNLRSCEGGACSSRPIV